MTRVILLLALALSNPESSQSDIRVRIRFSDDGRTGFQTLFQKGHLKRIDYEGFPRFARILNCTEGREATVNLDVGEYSLRKWPVHKAREGVAKSSESIRQEIEHAPKREIRDTGERREMFGYRARRVISQIIHKPWAGPKSQPHTQTVEEIIDGWYIDIAISEACIPADGTLGSNLAPSGVPAWLRMTVTQRIFSADGTTRDKTRTYEQEIVEVSKQPLDLSVFEIPPGFKIVSRVEIPR